MMLNTMNDYVVLYTGLCPSSWSRQVVWSSVQYLSSYLRLKALIPVQLKK